MKLLKQLNPDVATEGGAVEERKGINIDALNAFKGDEATGAKPAEEIKAPEKTPEGTATQENKPEVAPGTQQPGQDVKRDAATEGNGEKSPFAFSDEIKADDPNLNWKTTSKELFGEEMEGETFEDFKKNFGSFKEKLQNEARSESLIEQISKEPVEVQEAFLLMKNGYDLQEVMKPAHEADALLSLNNYDLVKWDFARKGFDPEAIDQRMEKLAENGEIDKLAGPIRNSVEEFKAGVLNERKQFVEGLRAQEQNRAIQEKQKAAAELQAELKKTADFMGTPLNDAIRDGIVKRFNEGRYDGLRNNTQALLNAIMFQEFGQTALNELKQRERAAAIEAHTKGLHNVPIKQQGINSQANTPKQGDGKNSNWGALSDFIKP